MSALSISRALLLAKATTRPDTQKTSRSKYLHAPDWKDKIATPSFGGWRLAAVGGWRLVAVGGWRLVAGGGRRRLAVGGWWRLAVVGGWQLMVGGGWWLAAVGGGWRLAVGGPRGLSLRAVLGKKKMRALQDSPGL